jgi:molybdenum cofactor sulfurtransferase
VQSVGVSVALSGSYLGELGEFLEAYPAYLRTNQLDDLRAAEFGRLDAQREIYLDYGGGALYAEAQVRRHTEMLLGNVFGNPHSSNPTAAAADQRLEFCRQHVLSFFKAAPDEYTVVFTANASQALKLVGEAFPFEPGGTFALTTDNHNSVNGIREFARARGAETVYVPVRRPELRVDADALDGVLRAGGASRRLFAFPAQSNFSGVQHPLEWIERAQGLGWEVLLDAAAFVGTNVLDLGRWHPDYVSLSFYKMFGYPSGVGALIARRKALERLQRPWFAGGTITVASVQVDRHFMASGSAGFEEGTASYLAIPAVDIGLEFVESVGLPVVHERVACLTAWLLRALLALRHDNGEPLLRLYGPASLAARGGTMTFNFDDRAGNTIDHRIVARQAAARHISLRTGIFCNPGAGETALGLSKDELEACFTRPHPRATRDDFRSCVDVRRAGAVRVSLGLASNFADVHAMVDFASQFLNWSEGAED